ncbi:group III truncated hemoglobin [Mucilaginibacter psychrotolerans]|uniref:Group III truncated hemoglobin n=1 Tax=Mucilaginibacter psychrotolerans TaxID=1524096 RepID=A0A4Y8S2G1_9SPHI|nr:group III truncated hemoglobin [Mucilaginibacter psychrotolerans]TFF33249.1 group III truncated hemoglobin [Mucilaginibacter psychrotolerans]
MDELPAILTIDDVKLLVDTFYERIQADTLLGPVFNEVIQDNWAVHLEKMYRFWQTVLLGEHTYFGSPFPPHAKLPVAHEHFETWMALFTKTVDELFTGEKADEAKWRAGKMAEMFELKIAYFKNRPFGIQ